MDDIRTVEQLCEICNVQNRIIKAQHEAMSQLGAIVAEEEELADVEKRYRQLSEKNPKEGQQ